MFRRPVLWLRCSVLVGSSRLPRRGAMAFPRPTPALLSRSRIRLSEFVVSDAGERGRSRDECLGLVGDPLHHGQWPVVEYSHTWRGRARGNAEARGSSTESSYTLRRSPCRFPFREHADAEARGLVGSTTKYVRCSSPRSTRQDRKCRIVSSAARVSESSPVHQHQTRLLHQHRA